MITPQLLREVEKCFKRDNDPGTPQPGFLFGSLRLCHGSGEKIIQL